MKAELLLCLLLVLTLFQFEYATAKAKKSKKRVEKESISIEPWEFCHGCRITVDTMVKKSSAKLADMQAARVDTKQTVEAAELVKELCDEPNFNTYRPFAKYSCVKLLNENATSFLLPFEGSFSPSFISAKGDIFDKTKEICVDNFNACSSRVFERGDILPTNRNKCTACNVIAYDLETANKVVTAETALPDVIETICERLGYNHKPYAWIESYCDEIIEENSDEILETMIFRNKVLKTGAMPDKSLGHLMCSELYGCDVSKPDGGMKKSSKSKQGKKRKDEF